MRRHSSHFQSKEPIGESFLQKFRFQKLSQYISPNSAVIDLGCGYDARFLHFLLPRLARGVGVDLSVRKSAFPGITTVVADLDATLPFPDNEFDYAISMANLEHLEHPEHLLQQAYRILRPGGTLLLTTPSTYSKNLLEFLAFRLHLVSADEIRDHKIYFNRKLLLQYLRQAGFKKITHRYFQLFMNNFVAAIK